MAFSQNALRESGAILRCLLGSRGVLQKLSKGSVRGGGMAFSVLQAFYKRFIEVLCMGFTGCGFIGLGKFCYEGLQRFSIRGAGFPGLGFRAQDLEFEVCCWCHERYDFCESLGFWVGDSRTRGCPKIQD